MYTLQCRSVLGFKSSPGIKKDEWSLKENIPHVMVFVPRARRGNVILRGDVMAIHHVWSIVNILTASWMLDPHNWSIVNIKKL